MKLSRIYPFLISILLIGFVACGGDDGDDDGGRIPPTENPGGGKDPGGEKDPPTEKNKYITGIDLSVSYNLGKSLPLYTHESYDALGYGYDITGKYAHVEGIRKKVVDPDVYKADFPNGVDARGLFTSRAGSSHAGSLDDVKKALLEDMKIDPAGISLKSVFKEVFETPFENDTSFPEATYYYSVGSSLYSAYGFSFFLHTNRDFDRLMNFLTDEFKTDLESKSAERIIELYGTHVMTSIQVGLRTDYYSRSTSNQGLELRLGELSSWLVNDAPEKYPSPSKSEKENLYIEYVSGTDPVGEPYAWMFDLTNFTYAKKFTHRKHKVDATNCVLMNWGAGSSSYGPLIPIYDFVSDPVKKEALKQAYQKYLNE